MKTPLNILVPTLFACGTQQGIAQYANETLSNLKTPTAINTALVPDKDNQYDLGSKTFSWRDIYFSGRMYLKGALVMHAPNTSFFVGYNAGNTTLTGSSNTGLGQNALTKITSGIYNVAGGYQALYNNTTGISNTATGTFALTQNTTGNFNTATGTSALSKSTTGHGNTAAGFETMYNNTTGGYNVAMGFRSLYSNTTGYSNIALGAGALYKNTAGNRMIAIGDSALFNQTTGVNQSIAIGSKALFSNISGNNNIAAGYQSMFANNTGNGNTAIGYQAMYSNTSGDDNTAMGFNTLFSNKSGSDNIAVGKNALKYNTTGNANYAFGEDALLNNTTGGLNIALGFWCLNYNTSGHNNIGIGNNVLTANETGNSNIAIGSFAMPFNSSGENNIGVGVNAAFYNITGDNNTAVGYQALASNMYGHNNAALGNSAGPGDRFESLSNTTSLGYDATVTASNQVRVGNSAVTSIGGYTGWTNISDERVKKNIKEDVPGLAFINKLTPHTYNLDLEAAEQITGIHTPSRDTAAVRKQKQTGLLQQQARREKEAVRYTGFIAQEVEQAAKELKYDFSGVDAAKGNNDLYGLRYAEFVVPLVKAVQELSAINKEKEEKLHTQQKQLDLLQQQLETLQKEVTALKGSPVTGAVNMQSMNRTSTAALQQNVPNPFSSTTVINYTLPERYTSARMLITDKYGKTVQQATLTGNGKNSLSLHNPPLAPGTYTYALVVDGKILASKEMLLAR